MTPGIRSLFCALALSICCAAPALAADDEMMNKPGASMPSGSRTAHKPGDVKTGLPSTEAPPPTSPLKWQTTWTFAAAEARKQNKLIMMYFTGSDWDDYSKKLQKEVLTTPMFVEWAQKNVVLFEVDFPAEKKQPKTVEQQNKRMKEKYSVKIVPTIIFADADGEPFVRAGYEQARLRDEEKKGQPLKWMEFADNVVQARPGQETLHVEKDFNAAQERARKTGLPLLLLLTKDKSPTTLATNKAVMESQKFIRFVNRTMLFMPIDWPDDADKSDQAAYIRKFIAANQIGNAPAQFLMYFAGEKKIKLKVTIFDASKIEALRKQFEAELPKFDYTGNWLTDFHVAQAVASQMKRELLVAFTSMDSSDWSKKIDEEIFKNPEFREYAGKNLVLCRVDFPKNETPAPDVAERNRQLAELYNVRGYPTIVILNNGGQKIGNAKYQKGGPRPFLQEIEDLRRKDYERKTLMSDTVEVVN